MNCGNVAHLWWINMWLISRSRQGRTANENGALEGRRSRGAALPSYGDSVKSTPVTASEAATATLSTWAGWNAVALAATL